MPNPPRAVGMGVILVHEDFVSAAFAGGRLRLSSGRSINAISMMIRIWIGLFIELPPARFLSYKTTLILILLKDYSWKKILINRLGKA